LLGKTLRRKLYEHKWVDIKNENSNPSQSLRRIKEAASTALRDLRLLSEKLPDKELHEIFTEPNVNGLILGLLKLSPILARVRGGEKRELDSWRTQLSASLVEKCIHFCSNQYEVLEEESPSLAETNIGHLRQSIEICKQIANAVELRELKSRGIKNQLTYLFNWDKIPGSDEKRLKKFLVEEFGIGSYEESYYQEVRKYRNKKQLSCWINFRDEDYGGLDMSVTLEGADRAAVTSGLSHLDGREDRRFLKVVEERGQKFIYKDK
jgi:hypothetical protein